MPGRRTASAWSWCCRIRLPKIWKRRRKKPRRRTRTRRRKTRSPKRRRPWVVDRYQFKEDEIGYLERLRTHLYVFDIAAKTLTQVTSGDFDDEHPAWSPDGKFLAFSSKRTLPDPDRNYDSNIFVVAADNTDKGAHPTQVTTSPGLDDSPAWSPDGMWIAYVTQPDPKLSIYGTNHIAVSPAGGGAAKILTTAFDRVSSEPHFSPDGKSIYFIADDDGTQNLCSIPAAGGEVTRPIGGRLMLYAYSVAKSGEVAAQITTPDRPSEIYTIPGGKLTQISHTNDAFISQVKLTAPEYVKFKSKDGTTVSGYLYKPIDYVPGKKYPAILRPHGGPVWSYYAEFTHLAQLFAANGYVVLYPNPRGSTGYGQAFAKAINADWGNKDFQDDMAMVDYAIAQGMVDPDKTGRRRVVVRRHLDRLHHRADHALQGGHLGRRLGALCINVRTRPLHSRLRTRAGISVERQSGLGQGLSVLQDHEHHHADAVHGRRY